ncbi:protein of unknown function [Bartonella clarridgeiae 73]|uniref:Uncharacterized protein n=1 Tax=Bartonella clarridgeiae (strain CCUG 45776 / CIP 104772 / 73) TaxID=696125 RepID=E6YGN0_BARC7|nr:protein of unknown function [Bartonella clarridgeiae 73]
MRLSKPAVVIGTFSMIRPFLVHERPYKDIKIGLQDEFWNPKITVAFII